MREAAFVKLNQKRWLEFENKLNSGTPQPDTVAEILFN